MSKAPKKSSKANTPSWRTMLRQATKLEALAKKKVGLAKSVTLRNAAALREQANLKHRSERRAKATKVVRKRVAKQLSQEPALKKLLKSGGAKRRRAAAKADPMAQAFYGDNAKPATLGWLARLVNQEMPLVQDINRATEQPGRGEIVGGEMAKLTEEIADLARKKGGKDEIQSKLLMATATAAYEGERKADRRHMQNVKDINEAHTDKVVCDFIATFEATEHRTGMLPAVNVSAYTMARIVDALNRAGYTAQGKH